MLSRRAQFIIENAVEFFGRNDSAWAEAFPDLDNLWEAMTDSVGFMGSMNWGEQEIEISGDVFYSAFDLAPKISPDAEDAHLGAAVIAGNPRAIFSVSGSHGTMHVDALSGIVLALFEAKDAEAPGYTNIACFDLVEWSKTYPAESIAGMSIDILDLGFWEDTGAYREPDLEWRKAFAADVARRTPKKEPQSIA